MNPSQSQNQSRKSHHISRNQNPNQNLLNPIPIQLVEINPILITQMPKFDNEIPVPVSSVHKNRKGKTEPSPSFNERQAHSEIFEPEEVTNEKELCTSVSQPDKLQKLKEMKKNKKAHSTKSRQPKGIFSDESESESDSNKDNSESSDEEEVSVRTKPEKEKGSSFLSFISDAMNETTYERTAKKIILKILKERKDKT